MKLTTKQIRQIIREEIKDTLSEASPQSEFGLPHKFTSEELIAVFEKQLNTPGHKIRSDKEYIEKAADQITNKMRKEPNKETRLKLRALREKIEEYTKRGRDREAAAKGRIRGSEQHARAVAAQKYKDQDPTQRIQRGYWGENKMKLTKTQLKQLIREALTHDMLMDYFDEYGVTDDTSEEAYAVWKFAAEKHKDRKPEPEADYDSIKAAEKQGYADYAEHQDTMEHGYEEGSAEEEAYYDAWHDAQISAERELDYEDEDSDEDMYDYDEEKRLSTASPEELIKIVNGFVF